MPRCYRCGKSKAAMKVVRGKCADDLTAENAALHANIEKALNISSGAKVIRDRALAESANLKAEVKRLTEQAAIGAFVKYAFKRACEELVEVEADLSRVVVERDAMEVENAKLRGECHADKNH